MKEANYISNRVEDLKSKEEIFVEDINIRLGDTKDSFDMQNNKVFMINLYVLKSLYPNEFYKIRARRDFFGLNEYYEFVESLELPSSLEDMYMSMPTMINNNKILSYVTDNPSYMGIKKNTK